MNDKSKKEEDRDTWQTPQELFNRLNQQYKFTLDCCADNTNFKCDNYCEEFELFDNMLKETCWLNPPFSKAYQMFKHYFKVVEIGVSIYRCDNMETKVWQDIIFKKADWVFIPNKRIRYTGFKGSGSRFASALIGVGVSPPMYDIGIDGTLLKIDR